MNIPNTAISDRSQNPDRRNRNTRTIVHRIRPPLHVLQLTRFPLRDGTVPYF